MPITVTVKTIAKEEYAVELPGSSATVGDLRTAAGQNMPIPAGGVLTLVHLGNVLGDDAKSLKDHGIADGAMLVAIIKKPKTGESPAVVAASPAPAAAAPTAAAPAPAGKTMRLTVSNVEGDVRVIEVDENETVDNVKAVLEIEFAVPLQEQVLFFEAKQMGNGQRLSAFGVKNDDMLMMQQVRVAPARPSGAPQRQGAGAGPLGGLNLLGLLGGGGAASARANPLQAHMGEANQLLQMAGSDPHFLLRIQENNKPLADAIATGNPESVAKELIEIQKLKKENEFKKQQAIMRLNADPFDVEAQKQIEEMVRMENVNANLEQVFSPPAVWPSSFPARTYRRSSAALSSCSEPVSTSACCLILTPTATPLKCRPWSTIQKPLRAW
jgi:hypothetical protein